MNILGGLFRRRRFFSVVFAGFVMASCSPLGVLPAALPHNWKSSAGFVPQEAAHIHLKGPGLVHGQIALVLKDGSFRYADAVELVPASGYAVERFKYIFQEGRGSKRNIQEDSHFKQYRHYVRIAHADGQGNYRFDNIVPGDYFVYAAVQWQGPGQYWPAGMKVHQRVTVPAAGPVEVNIVERYDPTLSTH